MTRFATAQENHLALLRMHGQTLTRRGDVLSWLGGQDIEAVARDVTNVDGDYVVPHGLKPEDIGALGPAARVWMAGGTHGDLIVGLVPTARGWAAATPQTRYVEARTFTPASRWWRVTVDAAVALFRGVLARPLDPEQPVSPAGTAP